MTTRKYRLTSSTEPTSSTGIGNIQEVIYAEYWLSDEEVWQITEATPVVKKFLEQSITEYQLGLAFWQLKGEEQSTYSKIEALQEFLEKIEALPTAKREYEKKIEEDIKNIKDKIED